MELLQSADFDRPGQNRLINIILSGDNAVVIALAARSLPPCAAAPRDLLWFRCGRGHARGLTVVAAKLLELPYLEILGGLLLLWIGVQLLQGEDEGDEQDKEVGSMLAAIRTILIADLVMSLDNVIAVPPPPRAACCCWYWGWRSASRW